MMESLHRGILAVGTLSPKNTSPTPPTPLRPIPGFSHPFLMTKASLYCRTVKFSQWGYSHVCPNQPHACSHCWNVTEPTVSHVHKPMHMTAHACRCTETTLTHTHVIRHVWNFYSVGHVSICGVAQTCSLSSKRPCFEIILGKSLFAVVILTVSAVVDLRSSAYTGT